jgi:hypothetical protein
MFFYQQDAQRSWRQVFGLLLHKFAKIDGVVIAGTKLSPAASHHLQCLPHLDSVGNFHYYSHYE